MDRIIITRPLYGICFMQLCAEANATDEELLTVCNRDNPSGTTNGWTRIEHEGDMAPVYCQEYPDRKHFIAVC